MARFILLLSFFLCSYVTNDKISVVVNKHPITEQEILDRMNFIVVGQKVNLSDADTKNYLRMLATNSLIDDYLLIEGAEKYKITASDQDVKNFIVSVEDSKHMKRGQLSSIYSSTKGLYNSFFEKMRAELVKSKVSNQVFLRQISVEDSEVDNLLVNFTNKNIFLSMKEYSTNDTKDSGYKLLKKIQNNNFSCSKVGKISKVTISDIKSNISDLTRDDKELVANIKQGEFSPIQERDGKLITYQICSKKVLALSQEEQNNIANMIGNKKINHKLLKYIESLRKKAYIKYM